MIEPSINQTCSDGAGSKNSSPYEVPAIEVNRRVSYLTIGYFVCLFQLIKPCVNHREPVNIILVTGHGPNRSMILHFNEVKF